MGQNVKHRIEGGLVHIAIELGLALFYFRPRLKDNVGLRDHGPNTFYCGYSEIGIYTTTVGAVCLGFLFFLIIFAVFKDNPYF